MQSSKERTGAVGARAKLGGTLDGVGECAMCKCRKEERA